MNFKEIWKKANKIARRKHLSITIHFLKTGFIEFVVTNKKNGERIGILQLIASSNELYTSPKRLRNTVPETVDSIQITWLHVEEAYRGAGMSLLLILYGLCYLKTCWPHIGYSVLDDTSDRSTHIDNNLYTQIGYDYVDPIQLSQSNSKQIEASSPTRSLKLDDTFMEKAYTLLETF